ncbi:MAG: antibiotic biosynthesis monooxygenase [Chloroflexi bacterium]|nr:antibiotic biosynthesis monooxygenase [Chloroflexota bacterium]
MMYGTVARMRVKPGMEDRFDQIAREIGVGRAPGQVAVMVYQLDRDNREFILTAVFENRDAYFANADSPEQYERFMKLMQVLDGEPEWNDGEIVYSVF